MREYLIYSVVHFLFIPYLNTLTSLNDDFVSFFLRQVIFSSSLYSLLAVAEDVRSFRAAKHFLHFTALGFL